MGEKSLSRFQLFVTPWTLANQAPPSMGFSGQEYWSGVPLPSPSSVEIELFAREELELKVLKLPVKGYYGWESISERGDFGLKAVY